MAPTELWPIVKDAIASVGFPIFVAVYLLVYHKKSLDNLTEAIKALTASLQKPPE